MSEELRRRFLNMDAAHSQEEMREVVKDFLTKMADSGYKHPARKHVILSAVRKFFRQILQQETGGRPLYRSSQEMGEARRLKALNNKS